MEYFLITINFLFTIFIILYIYRIKREEEGKRIAQPCVTCKHCRQVGSSLYCKHPKVIATDEDALGNVNSHSSCHYERSTYILKACGKRGKLWEAVRHDIKPEDIKI